MRFVDPRSEIKLYYDSAFVSGMERQEAAHTTEIGGRRVWEC
jgi:hypothetical protein